MAEMGLGYGSEYQLLRYLGHHRNELNKTIAEQTKLNGELNWLDFPKNNSTLSLDGEHKNIDFLKCHLEDLEYERLKNNWNKYWSPTGTPPNWDGIIIHKVNDSNEWIIVEAKAHLKELESTTESADNENIQNAFIKTQKNFGVSNNNWFGKYYQLANRLAFINFLLENNIKASLLYIYFINGYNKRILRDGKKETVEKKSVESIDIWKEALNKEYNELGLNEEAQKYISNVFIDCE
ncbi:MAG: hypothetical protein ACRC9X_02435 [Bacteroidales bacterium]